MIKRISLLITAALLVATMAVATAGPASAASPSQRECEAAGGDFQRTSGGQVECVIVDEGKNPKFTETETTTGQGNIGNKQQRDTECGGTGSGKCPPGQFND